jgi:hypothetical protein
MGWFRTRRKFGGRLALLALAVQLIISFGHIHKEDIFGAARTAASAATLDAAASDQPLPPDQPAGHAGDYCAICATIHLLGASVLGEPPQSPAVPLAFQSIEHSAQVTALFAGSRWRPFQSRAPPLA